MIISIRLARRIRHAAIGIMPCLLILGTAGGCGGLTLTSTFRSVEVTVDGIDDEWDGARIYLKEARIMIGLLNDSDNLYISLATGREDLRRQLMARGLTLWFDPEGGKEKIFGIRFPLGLSGAERPSRDRREREEPGGDDDRFRRATAEVEFLFPAEDERRRMPIQAAMGVEVRLGTASDRFVYELKIPLALSEEHPYAIGVTAGELIGIGLETPEIDRDAMRQRRGRGGFSGGGGRGGGMRGGGGRGGGMGGGRGGGGRGQRPGMPKPLKIWAKLQLADAEIPKSEDTSRLEDEG